MTTSNEYVGSLFTLDGSVAVITGATGVLGGAIAGGLARAGARVAILGRRRERAEEVAASIRDAGGEAVATPADVLDATALAAVRDELMEQFGRVDILVNAAGGNAPGATVTEPRTFFDLEPAALRQVIDLNLTGTLLPCQVFGAAMAERGSGAIVNISSMAAHRALTRVVAYSAAKAGIDAVTRWLAVEMARRHSVGIRVNAIAPGFFLGDQNRALLVGPDGSPTPRGATILAHTPAGRFGEPDELIAATLWLCGPGAAFVTGAVIPIDGGFEAFSGV